MSNKRILTVPYKFLNDTPKYNTYEPKSYLYDDMLHLFASDCDNSDVGGLNRVACVLFHIFFFFLNSQKYNLKFLIFKNKF